MIPNRLIFQTLGKRAAGAGTFFGQTAQQIEEESKKKILAPNVIRSQGLVFSPLEVPKKPKTIIEESLEQAQPTAQTSQTRLDELRKRASTPGIPEAERERLNTIIRNLGGETPEQTALAVSRGAQSQAEAAAEARAGRRQELRTAPGQVGQQFQSQIAAQRAGGVSPEGVSTSGARGVGQLAEITGKRGMEQAIEADPEVRRLTAIQSTNQAKANQLLESVRRTRFERAEDIEALQDQVQDFVETLQEDQTGQALKTIDQLGSAAVSQMPVSDFLDFATGQGLTAPAATALHQAAVLEAQAAETKNEQEAEKLRLSAQKIRNDLQSEADKAVAGVATLQTALDEGKIDQATFDALSQELGFALEKESPLDAAKRRKAEAEAEITEIEAAEAREDLQDAEPATPSGNIVSTSFDHGRNIKIDSVASPSLDVIHQMAIDQGISINGQTGFVSGGVGTSGFRSAEQQQKLYDAHLAGGPKAAPPGSSAHESGLAIDLFPDTEYISKMKPILESNGWKATGGHGDSGHFEYVGKQKPKLTATEETSIKKLAVDLFGKRAGTKEENVENVRDAFIENDRNIDATQDALRLAGFGEEFTGAAKRAFAKVNQSGFTAAQTDTNREELEDVIKEFGIDSNEAKETLLGLASAGSNIGVDARNKVEGRVFAIESLGAIQGLLDDLIEAGGDTGLITGSEEAIANKIGRTSDPAVANIATQILSVVQDYRRAITGAAFSEDETAEYEKLFPRIGNVPELNKARIDGLLSTFGRFADSFYRQKLGRTNFEEIYPDGSIPVLLRQEDEQEEADLESLFQESQTEPPQSFNSLFENL
jgi:LAS superfamily LD-carboxypeptidase LdcB